MEALHGSSAWELCMEALHGSSAWELCMEALHGSSAWKLCMGALHGSSAWELCMTLGADSDSQAYSPVTGQCIPSHPNTTHFTHSMKTSTSCDTITAISWAKGDAQAAIRIIG